MLVLIGGDEHVADSPYPVKILPARLFRNAVKSAVTACESRRVSDDTVFCVCGVDSTERREETFDAFSPGRFPSPRDAVIDDVEIADDGDGQYRVSFNLRKGFIASKSPLVECPSPRARILSMYEADVSGVTARDDAGRAPGDVVAEWEDIALKEYAFDGDDGGWASDESDEETDDRHSASTLTYLSYRTSKTCTRSPGCSGSREQAPEERRSSTRCKRFAKTKSKLALPTSDTTKGSIAIY